MNLFRFTTGGQYRSLPRIDLTTASPIHTVYVRFNDQIPETGGPQLRGRIIPSSPALA